ncbi:tetraprenyl-beta-curcumene synthase family protein [Paenibacillus sp. IB182496]|uniref:Tetraprenyl-beta-curcumene synthase family protein n=1 Tax=Paenibacillus sabuli TaxID=2772509 RepID=A0A927BUM0_9BACL|nr:tetraprenyl-beta-curcumene synthase family protein [Paenibacillus sabuli]MBD2846035.1 tetraprenyl-beta-curcumene synthase family protein [Paenibacillus sabuli]
MPAGPIRLMYRVYKYILPGVDDELARWRVKAENIPDTELRTQALASIETKRFHCQGGGVYAAANPPARHVLIPLIVALQTISDYLDNLCDRSTSMDGRDFRLLHQSMLDAVDPAAELQDYYARREESDDDGYLHALVRECQTRVSELPSYAQVQDEVRDLVGLYCDLQVHKHIRHEQREPALLGWWEENRPRYRHLLWNEFAAATGSTLGMFMLFLAASHPGVNRTEATRIRDAYFPHVCGLHIMLDYLIDQQEDREGGDLNFCNYYTSETELVDRISLIVTSARNDIRRLPGDKFHRMIIEGLLALYLSDPKARSQRDVVAITRRLMKRSPMTRLFFWANSMYIRSRQSK